MASDLLASISQDERERANYRSRRIFRMDMEHNLSMSRKEGLAEASLAFAQKLLKRNRPMEEIIEDTGLPRETIEALRTGDSAEDKA